MKRLTLSVQDFRSLSDDDVGFCTACGEYGYGVEPDARKYECEICGENKVYGLEELLVMGGVTIN